MDRPASAPADALTEVSFELAVSGVPALTVTQGTLGARVGAPLVVHAPHTAGVSYAVTLTPADVWALGMVLFSLAAGFFPLDEARSTAWRFARLAEA